MVQMLPARSNTRRVPPGDHDGEVPLSGVSGSGPRAGGVGEHPAGPTVPFTSGCPENATYLYLPSVAFSMVAAVRLCRPARLMGRARRLRVLAGTSAAVAVIFGLLTVVQGQAWSDEIALFTRACKVAPRNAHATQELAYALARSGNCQEAYPLLAELAELNPWVTQTPFSRGRVTSRRAAWARRTVFVAAIELDSGLPAGFAGSGVDLRPHRSH